MRADITQRRGAQQRVADGVGEHVAIGMAGRTFVKRDPHTAQD